MLKQRSRNTFPSTAKGQRKKQRKYPYLSFHGGLELVDQLGGAHHTILGDHVREKGLVDVVA